VSRIVFQLRAYSARDDDDDIDDRLSLRECGLTDNHTIYFDLVRKGRLLSCCAGQTSHTQ
jgi:hypothetical protein